MQFTQTSDAVCQLQSEITGNLITSNQPDYETTRRGWNLSFNHHPALIIIANNAQDVVAGVRFANQHNLGVNVQLTGHGQQQNADDSILIITSGMQGVSVDPESRTARVQAGVRWERVVEATKQYGLAPLLGTSPHVGVVGYTLGGGLSWLGRKYGYAAESVNWIEIVTADGEIRHAGPTENPDLFWAVRGGGGAFGVVTALEFALYPVASIYGGLLEYPAPLAGGALRFYRDWVKTLPDEMTSIFAFMKYPNFPQLPEALRGKVVGVLKAVYAGPAAEGKNLMQKWLDWNMPAHNTFRELPFEEIGGVANEPVNPSPSVVSNEMLNSLPDEAIDLVIRYMSAPESPLVFSEFRHVGGAMSRPATNDSAISNRDAQFYLQIGGLAPTPDLRTAIESYRARYKADLRPYLRGSAYLNFMWGDDARARVREAFPAATLDRLVAIKTTYDPRNIFRFSYQFASAPVSVQAQR